MVGGRGLIRVEATMIEEIAAHFADLAELLVRVSVERLELPLVHERVVVVVHLVLLVRVGME